jgi:hypothetical protein
LNREDAKIARWSARGPVGITFALFASWRFDNRIQTRTDTPDRESIAPRCLGDSHRGAATVASQRET